MQYDFDKKEAQSKAEQAMTFKELQRQKLVRNSLAGGLAIVLLFALVFLGQRNKIRQEKKRSDELLLNILPDEVANEIKQNGRSTPKTFSMVTVMFTDFKDFTRVSQHISAELLVAELDYCFSGFDKIMQKYKIEKIKTVGDAYLCASGMPVSNFTHATDMVTAAIEIRNFMLVRKQEKESKGEVPFELRLGIHTGPVVAGIVGIKKYAYDIWGDTVNLAARMEQHSEAGKNQHQRNHV
jgi:class 3 adenylate cyclase